MKNQKLILGLFLLFSVSLVFFGCSKRDDPKVLAREMLELTKQLSANPGNKEQIQAKIDNIDERVKNLSLTNQLTYAAELTRLGASEIRDVFSSDEVQGSLNELNNSLDELRNIRNSDEVQSSLNELNSSLDELRNLRNSDEIQGSLDELNSALDALRNLNF